MSTVWDDLMESAKNLADKAGKATDKAVVYSKMKYQSMQLASDLRGLYEKLGNAVYTMVKSDFDNKDVKKRLEDLNVKMAEQRNAVVCPACGAVSSKEASYCYRCGNKFVPQEESCCDAPAETSEETGAEAAETAAPEENTGADNGSEE